MKKQAGFTIVELLVTIFALGVAGTFIYIAFHFLMKVW